MAHLRLSKRGFGSTSAPSAVFHSPLGQFWWESEAMQTAQPYPLGRILAAGFARKEHTVVNTRLTMSQTTEDNSPSTIVQSQGPGTTIDHENLNSNPVTEKEEETPNPGPPPFPEGGLAGWATVVGAFLVQFCGFGYTTSYGVYQDYYTRVYITNQSSSTISWIGSVNAFLVISSGLVVGRLYDRGYFYFLLYGGSFLIAFSLFMLSLSKPNHFYQIFLSQGLGAGLGAGMIYVPSVAVVSHYFMKRRAMAMTIVSSGSSLGAVLHPIMLNNTLNGRLGFAKATRASAGLISGLLLIACLLMRTRLPPPKKSAELGKALRKFSRDGAYIAATLGLTLFTLGFYFPLFYLQLDASSHGLNKTFAFYSLVIMNSSSFIGRLTPGFVAHIFGVGNMVAVATGSCSVLIFGMIGLKTVASVVVIGIIYGFFVGTFVALMAPLMAVLTDDLSELGARMGIAFAFSGIGGLIGTPIDGALLTSKFIWWRPALFSGIVATIGFSQFILMLIILRRRKQRKA